MGFFTSFLAVTYMSNRQWQTYHLLSIHAIFNERDTVTYDKQYVCAAVPLPDQVLSQH
jgi:hypothetical protein